jgi:haloacetate dehalogenase
MFSDFESKLVELNDTTIFVRQAGEGSPVLLLHGFPQTHLMWRDIASGLATDFKVICADLTGYGKSGCPASPPDHSRYSKRALGADMTLLMEKLGHSHFHVVGHDRGARVAYRMALDYPEQIKSVALFDIIPGSESWARANAEFTLAFWPWSLLAQPAPLPEELILAAPRTIINHALSMWSSDPLCFGEDVRDKYTAALQDPAHVHAICEEFRASATIDREHDRGDQQEKRRIQCPGLILWGARGILNRLYRNDGGPLGIWAEWIQDLRGHAVDGGHFFPEENPGLITGYLKDFYRCI